MDAVKLPLGVEFVFLDGLDELWPYAVKRHADGGWWLYRWCEGPKSFVTMRALSAFEVAMFNFHALPYDQAKLYFKDPPRS